MFHNNPTTQVRHCPLWRGSYGRMASCLLLVAVGCGGCTQEMADQPRLEPLERSEFFADGRGSRPLVAGTVPRGESPPDAHFDLGLVDGQPAATFPVDVDDALLARGQQRFNIFCAACHDRTGSGHGIVVRRGFPQPPSFHRASLRDAPVGRIYRVATFGFGKMPDYGSRMPPRDRWAVVAYIRALQLSQAAGVEVLTEEDRRNLEDVGP